MAKASKIKIVSVDYRLASENKFLNAVNDAHDSFRYVYSNSNAFA